MLFFACASCVTFLLCWSIIGESWLLRSTEETVWVKNYPFFLCEACSPALGLFPNLFHYGARKMVVPAEVKGDIGAGMSNGERG